MIGVIEKSSNNFICFISHPMKCGGTTLREELQKHEELEVVHLIPECEHYTPYEIANMMPQFWNEWKHLPIYCITRHPYERFNSQLSFIPVVMEYGGRPERFFEKTPHQLSGHTLFCPQWKYMSWKGEKLKNIEQIRLEDVTGTVIYIEGFKVDMRKHYNTNEEAYEEYGIKPSGIGNLFGERTKEYIQKCYSNDFENLGYYK